MNRIAIVGGGIAGLALATILDPDRFDVTLYEQQPGRYGLPTALAMWPGAQRALSRMGAAGVLESAVDVAGSLHTMTGEALISVVADSGRLVARSDLVRELERGLPDSLTRVTARLDDPRSVGADLVVGADGVHSLVRRSAWGEGAASTATPYLAVRGLVPGAMAGHGEYWGEEKLFGITAVPGERTNWFCAYRSVLGPRSVDVAEALTDARRCFDGAAPAVVAVLAAATLGSTLAQRIWVAPPMRSYSRGRVVLIGDAAHAMTPNLGRGACESIVDDDVLGAALNSLDIDRALRRYNTRRTAKTQAARAASAAIMRLALSRRSTALREAALRRFARLA